MKKTLSFILVAVLSAIIATGCSQNTAQVPNQSMPDTSKFIGEERAKEIAVQRAGITDDDVIFDRVELDLDNGMWHYEIDFRQGTTEYEADIKAVDGTIISFETDFND